MQDNFPIDKAVQFYLNPFTAWGLLEQSKIKSGQWLLLTAASSVVSKLIIQLAQLQEIKVIAAIRDFKHADELKALGASIVLNTGDEHFSEQVNAVTSGKGVNAALDAVGGVTGTKVLQSMAPNGRA